MTHEVFEVPPSALPAPEPVENLVLRPFRGAALTHLDVGRVAFADEAITDWHACCLERPDLHLKQIRARLTVTFSADADCSFFVRGYGDRLLLELAPDGTVISSGESDELTVDVADGSLAIDVRFLNLNPFIFFGSAKGAPQYPGSGKHLFVIEALDIVIEPYRSENMLRIVDVGAAGGIQAKWARHANLVKPVFFEPNAVEAAKVRRNLENYPDSIVIEKALANTDGPRTLYVAAAPDCSSVLKPNFEVLNNYGARRIFETVGETVVDCARYDTLHKDHAAPAPDVIKIDVQGFEFEVLLGFGSLLQTCLGVELETHLYPIYREQKLLHDIVGLLNDYGLVLRSIRPVPNFDGDIVEVDAFFTRRVSLLDRLGPAQRRKHGVICAVWGLPEAWPYAE